MAQRTTLTEKQVEVLAWVAEGCPAGVMDTRFIASRRQRFAAEAW